MASSIPAYYCIQFDALRKIANAHGYTLALHGSLQRDLDVVAVPWGVNVSTPHLLAQAMERAVVGNLGKPEKKPHGRIAYSIQFGGGPYLDLSIMKPHRMVRRR